MKSRFLFLSLFLGLPVSLPGGTEAKNAQPPAPSDAPVILKMMQRDRIVTVRSDGGEPRYTVETKAGEILARDARLDDLKASNPGVYELVKGAVAGASGVIDASVDKMHLRETKLDASVP